MEKKTIAVITLLITTAVFLFANIYQYQEFQKLTWEYQILSEQYSLLELNYETLEVEHETLRLEHETLIAEYDSLKSEHSALRSEYDKLSADYKSLESDYNSLEMEYDGLEKKYQKLFSDYTLLEKVFDKPLSITLIPTINELQIWLYEDKTNQIEYNDPRFVCGDYAVMLAMHAKTKNWDTGVVAVFGYDKDTHEDFAHALNAIRTTEGLVYIEPQTDEIWWYEDHKEIYATTRYYWGFPNDQWIFVEDYVIILQY